MKIKTTSFLDYKTNVISTLVYFCDIENWVHLPFMEDLLSVLMIHIYNPRAHQVLLISEEIRDSIKLITMKKNKKERDKCNTRIRKT